MTSTKGGKPKLPTQQLAILAVARFAEPMAMTSVNPYLPDMVASFGVPQDDVAKWAGLTSAVFSFSQSLTAVFWGRASDKFGRKPTIMVGLVCTMICFLVWGMSTSLRMAIAVRAVQGGSNGNVGIIRTVVAEMVTEKELQPKAFSIMPLVWSLGSIVGPSFGGAFAKPADQYPALFGDNAFLKKYPFALPNIVACVVFLISLASAGLFLRETLESKRHEKDWGIRLGEKLTRPFKRHIKQRSRRFSFQDDEATAPLLANSKHAAKHGNKVIDYKAPAPSSREIFTPQTTINLVAYTFLALHSVAYDQVLPVYLSYPVEKHTPDNVTLPFRFSGGFGLEPGRIGTIFTVYGIACGLIQFIVFPPMCSYFGSLKCLKACAVTFPIVYLLTPFTSLVEDEKLKYVVLLSIMMVKAFCVIVGFPCTTILLTNSAKSLSILGTLNGFATTFSALGRASGPAMAGGAFSWGVKHGIIGVPWWILMAIAAMGAVPVWWIEEGAGPTHHVTDSDDETLDGDEAVILEEDEEDEDTSDARETPATLLNDPLDVSGAKDDLVAEPAAQSDLPIAGSLKSQDGSMDYGTLSGAR